MKLFQAKAYRDYVSSKKNLELLTEEDRFIHRLSYTERLATKLHVMYYIGNFFDQLHLITPVRSNNYSNNSSRLTVILFI